MKEYNATGIQILEAAKSLFAEKGYKGTSTKKIAQAAKVNEVTIFRIFGSKEKLFEVTFEYFFFKPNFKSLFQVSGESLEEVLMTFGTVMHKFFVGNVSLIKMEIQNQDILAKQRLNRFPNEIKQLLTAQFQKYYPLSDREAELQAICFMTALQGFCLNLYVFKAFTENVQFEPGLKILVDKFK